MQISLRTLLLLHFPCHSLPKPSSHHTVCNFSMRLAHYCQNSYLIRAHSSYVMALRIKINEKKNHIISVMSCILLAFDFALMYSCHETYSPDFCMLCALHVNFNSSARVIVVSSTVWNTQRYQIKATM